MLSQFTLLLQERDAATACKRITTQTKDSAPHAQSGRTDTEEPQAPAGGKAMQEPAEEEEDETDEAEGLWADNQGEGFKPAPKRPLGGFQENGEEEEEEEEDPERDGDYDDHDGWMDEVYGMPKQGSKAAQRPPDDSEDADEDQEEEDGPDDGEGEPDEQDYGDDYGDEDGDDSQQQEEEEDDVQGPDSWHPFFKHLMRSPIPPRFKSMLMPFSPRNSWGGRRLLQEESQDTCMVGADSWNLNSIDTTLPPGAYTLWVAKSPTTDTPSDAGSQVWLARAFFVCVCLQHGLPGCRCPLKSTP